MPIQKAGSVVSYTADVWQDLTAALGASPTENANAGGMTWQTVRNNIKAWRFSNASSVTEGLYVYFHVPHDWKPGSTAYIHVHTCPDTAGQTGTVRFRFEYTVAKGHTSTGNPFPATQTINLDYTTSATQYQHQITEDTVGISLLEVDSIVMGYLYRDGAAGTNTGNQFAVFCDFHYLSDRSGTSQKAAPFDT